MITQDCNILCWNVRGLNSMDRKTTVHETIAAAQCQIVCLQESKLPNMDHFTASFLGGHRLKQFAQRPAQGTRGGILLLWDEDKVRCSNIQAGEFCLSAQVLIISSNEHFKITTVYGPTASSRKEDFHAELLGHKPPLGDRWLVCGDFNQIHRACDKNKPTFNRLRIRKFREALASGELSEIHLQNRRFTRSNERETPTLSKLDSFFCNSEWDTSFQGHILHALSSSLSDHCPLLLFQAHGPKRPKTFRFENFWISMPNFRRVVQEAWGMETGHSEPYHILFHKLQKTASMLQVWSKQLFSNTKIQPHAALHVILHLDMAQESRLLSQQESELRARLKRRVISLAVLERTRKKQCARIKDLKYGDANTKYFHTRINARRRKNYIHRLKVGPGWVTSHAEKEKVAHEHFSAILQNGAPRSRDLNWEGLQFNQCDLTSLGDAFTESEVLSAISQMPGDKAPGPDGFTGAFFKSCWSIIKVDMMKAINAFSNLQTTHLHWLNSANIVLLPKKDGAEDISDFHPISLIHAFTKILSKIMASRLAPFMNGLISNSQSAFIKSRSIHDNFMFVRGFVRRLHRNKTPSLLLKLDIMKAFDSIHWDYILDFYILDLLQRRGFPPRFRNWITAIWASSSLRVLINGIPGEPIKLGRGLRQGDSLSLLLFVIAIDPLQQLLDKATDLGLLHRLRGQASTMRTSLYADDAAIFMAPIKEDIQNLAAILANFGEVSGLKANPHKSIVAPIHCANVDLDDILQSFPATRAAFPLRYLGLPLSTHKLKKSDCQFLVDKVARKLPPWQGWNINIAGRTTLVKSVLSSLAIYFITALNIPAGTSAEITKIQRAFLWAGTNSVSRGQCKVNWKLVCRPLYLGGLGILDLEKFSKALRLRWLWFQWAHPTRAWVGFDIPCGDDDMDLFYSATTVIIGDGKKASFWFAPWLQGQKPKDLAPDIFALSKCKAASVAHALTNDAWIRRIDTHRGFSLEAIQQFINLWTKIQEVHLEGGTEDAIRWKFTGDGCYTAATAYQMQFAGAIKSDMPTRVWKVWAPPKVKLFSWLIIQDRVWAADRLTRRGWPNCGLCQLCKAVPETASHLFFKCRYSVRIWNSICGWLGFQSQTNVWADLPSVNNCWDAHGHIGTNKRAFKSMMMLVCWAIWNERNARVFQNKASLPSHVVATIKADAILWTKAGARSLGSIIPGE